MLLIGNGCITAAEEEAQMAIWSVMASPLIMGNDVRAIKGDVRDPIRCLPASEISPRPIGCFAREPAKLS